MSPAIPTTTTSLECSLAAGSDCIVTYDHDLLRLGEYAGIKIVTAVDFLQHVTEP
jgi:predicted nucleic acid-binding protein